MNNHRSTKRCLLVGLFVASVWASACATPRSIALKAESTPNGQLKISLLGTESVVVQSTVVARGMRNNQAHQPLGRDSKRVAPGTPQVIDIFQSNTDQLRSVVWTATAYGRTAQISWGVLPSQSPSPLASASAAAAGPTSPGLDPPQPLGNQRQPIQPMCIEIWYGPPDPTLSKCNEVE